MGINAPCRSTLVYANEHRPWQLYQETFLSLLQPFLQGEMIMNIPKIIELNANKYPDKLALRIDDREKTFRELDIESNSIANTLLSMGFRPKDKVATLFFNDVDLILAYFALLKIGVQVVPINFRLAPPEIEYIMNHSEAKGLIYEKHFSQSIDSITKNLKGVCHYIISDAGGSNQVCFEDLKQGNTNPPRISIKDDDFSFLMYTSGTTGRPKGVMITHYNSLWNALSLCITSELKHKDIVLNPMPLFHGGALNRYQAFFIMGSTFISLRNFEAQKVLDLIQKYRVTYLCMVPAMANMIFQLESLAKYDLSSVRECLVTSAITPVAVKKKVAEVFFNAGLIDGYGLTEATSCGTGLKPEDAFRKLSSVGLPYHFNEAKIVDENGTEVAVGEVGEIIIRGPNVMQCYYQDPKATEETIKNGWLHTGDLGRKDEEGYFYIVDRKKDMIISGGENIYPAEVEAVLNSHPKVLESAVIGLKDPKWGETVLALIVPKVGETITKDEIDQYCMEQIAKYKRPRMIAFINNLPRNPSGKILKTELRKSYGSAISYY